MDAAFTWFFSVTYSNGVWMSYISVMHNYFVLFYSLTIFLLKQKPELYSQTQHVISSAD